MRRMYSSVVYIVDKTRVKCSCVNYKSVSCTDELIINHVFALKLVIICLVCYI